MLSEILSIVASSVFAFGILMIRISLNNIHYAVASLFINLFGLLFFSLLGCITNSKIDSILASMFFFFAGVFSPGLVRYTYYRGIFYLGAALNASIFAMWPLFAFVLSIFLLRETSTIGTYLGGIVIVVGIILLYLSMNKGDIGKANPKYTLSSFLAAIFAAIATVLRKEGLNIQPDPILGVWIGYLAATLTSFAITPKDLYKLIFKIPKKLFLAGFCLCFAWLTFFYALKFGDASTVSALMNLEAIFIVFFSKIFLRAYEKVGNILTISTILIVIGASLIFLY